MTKYGICSVVRGECKAPAGLQAGGLGGGVYECQAARVSECHWCGADVCTSADCSRVVLRDGKKRRVCTDCLEQTS